MTEIIKADKALRLKLLIFTVILVSSSAFLMSDFHLELVRGDTANLSNVQTLQGFQKQLKVSAIYNGIWLLVILFFSVRFCSVVKQTFKESRFPPINCRVPVDTKVVYGKQAKLQGALVFICMCLLVLTPVLTFYNQYQTYQIFSGAIESDDDFQSTLDAHYQKLIDENPNAVQSISYFFKLEQQENAINLMNKLILQGSDRALFAKSIESLKGEHLLKETVNSVASLNELCRKYIEPCLQLAIYFKDQKDYDSALLYFSKAESGDYEQVYREIRYIYNRLNLNDRDKLDEYTVKMNQAKFYLCDDIYCLTPH